MRKQNKSPDGHLPIYNILLESFAKKKRLWQHEHDLRFQSYTIKNTKCIEVFQREHNEIISMLITTMYILISEQNKETH